MELASKILLLIILSIIIYQDFKHRAIWWFLIPIASILQVYVSIAEIGFSLFYKYAIVNCIVVTLQLLALFLYLKLKYKLKAISALFQRYLGMGDVLYFFVLALAFSPVNFVLFLVLMLVLSLISSVFIKAVKRTVPLAGILALGYLLVLTSTFFTKISTFDEMIKILP